MTALPLHAQRPELRPPCREWGTVERAYGQESRQILLGFCECKTWQACEGCGQPHVWVYRCAACASMPLGQGRTGT